tara:strand:+ start:3317 stop:4522 length:1206 start_codon:yes stop_codon:yes gene_type:complete
MSMLEEKFKTLDKQWETIPKKVVFCKNCVVSNQRPRTRFNKDGICSACQWAYEKDHTVDWDKRENELIQLCDKFRKNDGSFDVVVPGSGGKDSAYVAHQLKHRYGMHPLCVTWSPFEYTEIGWQNLKSFIASGFTNIMGQQDGKIHRKLSKLAFELKGDAWEPFTYGQKAWAFHIATRFDVKLIMYGENGELEYGGSEKYKNVSKEGPEEWEEEYFKGSNVDDLAEIGLERGYFEKNEILDKTLQLYKAPHPDTIIKSEAEMHWYSYYHKWTPQEHYYYAFKHTGLRPNPEGRSEGTYTMYESLDDLLDGIHWYQSYAKFGMSRCSRNAQSDIRRNHITREEGVALVNRYDGELPVRDYNWFLKYIDIDEDFFWRIINKYRELSNVWEIVDGEWKMIYKVK